MKTIKSKPPAARGSTLDLQPQSRVEVVNSWAKKRKMWAWRSLYLVLVEEGCILPVQFYTDLSFLFVSHKMIQQ